MDSLVMRRSNLEDLPSMPELPAGYLIRESTEADAEQLSNLLGTAFPDSVWSVERTCKEFTDDPNVVKTFVIEKSGTLVATSTALLSPNDLPGTGIVHWVGGSPSESGKRLGVIVVLATLNDFVRIGCKDSLLRTDDMRLPAIKTYLNLGFKPDFNDDNHRSRWKQVFAHLGI